jgi:hypothetical protein
VGPAGEHKVVFLEDGALGVVEKVTEKGRQGGVDFGVVGIAKHADIGFVSGLSMHRYRMLRSEKVLPFSVLM